MFNEKENGLLQDLKKSEQLCVEKYKKYENEAAAPQLKELCRQIVSTEQGHLQTICKVMQGETPSMGGSQNSQQPIEAADYSGKDESFNKDKYICNDALSTEKHVSSVYDTCIFEFKNPAVRNILNHIQKEEQGHGEKLYNYMAQNNMYS